MSSISGQELAKSIGADRKDKLHSIEVHVKASDRLASRVLRFVLERLW